MIPPQVHRIGPAELQILPDPTTLAEAAADDFIRAGQQALRERGIFNVALSGGSTPKAIYSHLSSVRAGDLPWEKVHLFFGDERHVPPTDPNSNYRMTRETLLVNPQVRANLHRIEAELAVEVAADRYEAEVRRHFRCEAPAQPRFDLILLGMGGDGHTASLFPGTSALTEQKRAVVANHVPQLKTDRITLTFPVLNAGRRVVFLTAGGDKNPMLRQVFAGLANDQAAPTFPCQTVRPTDGALVWMTDAAGAVGLV